LASGSGIVAKDEHTYTFSNHSDDRQTEDIPITTSHLSHANYAATSVKQQNTHV